MISLKKGLRSGASVISVRRGSTRLASSFAPLGAPTSHPESRGAGAGSGSATAAETETETDAEPTPLTGAAELEQAAVIMGTSLVRASAEALEMFIRMTAAQMGVPASRALFSFVVALVLRLHRENEGTPSAAKGFEGITSTDGAKMADGTLTAEGTSSADGLPSTAPLLGDLARQFLLYPAMAYHVAATMPALPMDPLDRIRELAAALDRTLPIEDPVETFRGREVTLRCTRLAARCAVPLAFGLEDTIPQHRFDFIIRSVTHGELKSIRYALACLAVESSAPEHTRDEDGEDGSEEEDDDEARDEAGDEAGDDEAGDEVGEARDEGEDDDEDAVADVFRPLHGGPARSVRLRGRLSSREFKSVIERIPAASILPLLHALRLHDPPGDREKMGVAAREAIENAEPLVPASRGSILRAYFRSVGEINVDERESDIQTMADCVHVARE